MKARNISFAAIAALPLVCSTAFADRNPETVKPSGDVAASNFSEYCRDDLPENRRTRFYAELQKAESSLASGNTDGAMKALGEAWREAYRGDAYNDNGIRCLGEATTRRWVAVNITLWRRG
ncbi:MAG: hypothetical protein ACR2P6_09020, partial [Gammaproteobacteria bacterium]